MHKSGCPAILPPAVPAPPRTYLVSTPTRRANHIVETLLAVVVEHVGGICEVRLLEIQVPVEVDNAKPIPACSSPLAPGGYSRNALFS
jgi:hypothetical protein